MADFINYANIAPQDLQSGLPDIFKNVLQGYQIAKAPGDMAIGRQKSIADAMLAGLKAQAYPEESRADIAYKQAEAYKAMHPELYQELSGPAAEANAIKRLSDQYGEDSDVVKTARSILNSRLATEEANRKRAEVLSSSQEFRARTPLEKLQNDRAIIEMGLDPISGEKLSDDEKQQRLDEIGLQINESTSDADTRKRNLYATNIEQTLSSFNPDDLFKYSGLKNAAKLKEDEALDKFGKSSAEYKKYKAALVAMGYLTTQVRQFYGDSIQPAAVQELGKLLNPVNWQNSPETAAAQFNMSKNILAKEIQTYRNALKNKKVYQGDNSISSSTSSSQDETRTWNRGWK